MSELETVPWNFNEKKSLNSSEIPNWKINSLYSQRNTKDADHSHHFRKQTFHFNVVFRVLFQLDICHHSGKCLHNSTSFKIKMYIQSSLRSFLKPSSYQMFRQMGEKNHTKPLFLMKIHLSFIPHLWLIMTKKKLFPKESGWSTNAERDTCYVFTPLLAASSWDLTGFEMWIS